MVSKIVFLVLGVGNAQIDLLRFLHSLAGIEIHALSYCVSERAASFYDYFSLIDITDKRAVLEYAKDKKITHIYTVGSEVAMPTVSWVSQQLALPYFVDFSTATLCQNKLLLREKLRNSFGSVKFCPVKHGQTAIDLVFPLIIKPVDSQGQRGISLVQNRTGLDKALSVAFAHSKLDYVIAEQFIDGNEISVNAYVINGNVVFSFISDRIVWDEFQGGIIKKHQYPSSQDESAQKEVHQLVNETVHSLGIKNGPIYFQIMISDGHPYIIEVTPRLDGCHMWRFIEKIMGSNLLDFSVKHLLGEVPEILNNRIFEFGVLEFFCQSPNSIFSKFKNNDVDICFDFIEYYYKEGESVEPINGYMEKCGYYIKVD